MKIPKENKVIVQIYSDDKIDIMKIKNELIDYYVDVVDMKTVIKSSIKSFVEFGIGQVIKDDEVESFDEVYSEWENNI